MQYREYYQSALRHLEVCKMMMQSLESMDAKIHNTAKRERLKLDIYYLSGYIIETMISMAHCDYSGVSLLGIKICDTVERKMFNEWSEVVRYQNPKTYSNLDFTVEDLKKYIEDIDLMFDQLKMKYL